MDDDGEGRAARNMFRTDSDSDEDDNGPLMETNDGIATPDCTTGDAAAAAVTTTTSIVRRIMHVELEEISVGGSIEHRLWPAAEYLASYVLLRQAAAGRDDEECDKAVDDLRADPRKEPALKAIQNILSERKRSLKIIELGAGVGLTSLELVSQLEGTAEALLTDLVSGLSLLTRNVERNRQSFQHSNASVKKLEWGNMQDIDLALKWYRDDKSSDEQKDSPLLILGSDCVYWECLYQPLEETIAALLKQAEPGSICLLAGMRRWKRDNHFYKTVLGKSTATATHSLECVCVDERVTRNEEGQREVMRVYAVQWVCK